MSGSYLSAVGEQRPHFVLFGLVSTALFVKTVESRSGHVGALKTWPLHRNSKPGDVWHYFDVILCVLEDTLHEFWCHGDRLETRYFFRYAGGDP